MNEKVHADWSHDPESPLQKNRAFVGHNVAWDLVTVADLGLKEFFIRDNEGNVLQFVQWRGGVHPWLTPPAGSRSSSSFLAQGITHMFGNPGTVEQAFLDAMADYPGTSYFLTLQESVAVLVADGYARSTGGPALVQIHSSPGRGNAVGALYQAKRGHAPLVVIGGDAGVRYQSMDAQMAADLVGMAAPGTKWATTVTDSGSLLRVLWRAVKVALTPPRGPVYVCLPEDVLDHPATEDIRAASVPGTRVAPDDEDPRAAAIVLARAAAPMVFVGDGVASSRCSCSTIPSRVLSGSGPRP